MVKRKQKGKGEDEKFAEICKLDDYDFEKILGKGMYGEVRVACYKNDCKYVAKISEIDDPLRLEIYANEIKLYNVLKDENITPKFYDNWICYYEEKLYGILILERMDQTAFDYLKGDLQCSDNDYKSCATDFIMFFNRMYNICKILEKYKIMHLDMKPTNILFNGEEFYLADFGLSHKYGDNKELDNIFASQYSHLVIYDFYKIPNRFVIDYDFVIVLYLTIDLLKIAVPLDETRGKDYETFYNNTRFSLIARTIEKENNLRENLFSGTMFYYINHKRDKFFIQR